MRRSRPARPAALLAGMLAPPSLGVGLLANQVVGSVVAMRRPVRTPWPASRLEAATASLTPESTRPPDVGTHIPGLHYLVPILSPVIDDPRWQRLLEQIGPLSTGLAVQATGANPASSARTAYEHRVESAYDEVAARVRSEGSMGKSDIGALLLGKRLRADHGRAG